MSSDNKIDKLKKVTVLFDQFVDHLDTVKENMDSQSKFSEGYIACLKDIISSLDGDEDSELIGAIKSKIDMNSRKEVLGELAEGLEGLRKAYKNILEEE